MLLSRQKENAISDTADNLHGVVSGRKGHATLEVHRLRLLLARVLGAFPLPTWSPAVVGVKSWYVGRVKQNGNQLLLNI